MSKKSNVIQFPTDRTSNSRPVRPELSEEEHLQIKENLFIDQLTEEFALDFIHVLQENAVDTKKDLFLKDLAIVVESIKSLLKRDFDGKHAMQNISDNIVKIKTLKDGKKITEINYGNVILKKQKSKKNDSLHESRNKEILKDEEEKEQIEVEFTLDPDIKLD